MKIPCNKILYDPDQNVSREPFELSTCENLAADIAQHGLTHPVIVIPIPEHQRELEYEYKLIVGFRRFSSIAFILNHEEIECSVRTDIETAEQAFILNINENLMREDMTFWEECIALSRTFDPDATMTMIAQRLGVTRAWVRPRWLLWQLPEEVIVQIKEGLLLSTDVNLLILQSEEDQIAAANALIEAAKSGVSRRQTARDLRGRKVARPLKEVQRVMTLLMDMGKTEHAHVLRFAVGEISDEQLFKYIGCEKGTPGSEVPDNDDCRGSCGSDDSGPCDSSGESEK